MKTLIAGRSVYNGSHTVKLRYAVPAWLLCSGIYRLVIANRLNVYNQAGLVEIGYF